MLEAMNFTAISVEIGIAALMAVVLVTDLVLKKDAPRCPVVWLTVAGLLAVLALAVGMYPPDGGATAFYAGLYIHHRDSIDRHLCGGLRGADPTP